VGLKAGALVKVAGNVVRAISILSRSPPVAPFRWARATGFPMRKPKAAEVVLRMTFLKRKYPVKLLQASHQRGYQLGPRTQEFLGQIP